MTNLPFFVFDVESIGLHGEGFAVAGGVYFADGTVDKDSEFVFSCHPDEAEGNLDDREWVMQNVPLIEGGGGGGKPRDVRLAFWKHWIECKSKYPQLVMAAECAWPVETNFLSACVADDGTARNWEGPYPLHEISSYLVAAGMDPMATYDRLQSEMPKHHPLGDARHSSRLLCESLEAFRYV